MNESLILTEENGVLTLTMNSAGNNLMTGSFFEEYEAVMAQVEEMAKQGGIKGMVICGGGRHFSVGADVEALAERSTKEIYDDSTGILPESHLKQKHLFTFLRELPFPVVSAVTGFCIGSGSEIAVNSHFRIVEKNARVGQPESTFGILPALGGIARTIDICGLQTAFELVMSGELISADRAFELGWADILADKKQSLPEAYRLIDFIAEKCGEFDGSRCKEYIKLFKKEN